MGGGRGSGPWRQGGGQGGGVGGHGRDPRPGRARRPSAAPVPQSRPGAGPGKNRPQKPRPADYRMKYCVSFFSACPRTAPAPGADAAAR
ncbi:hypothetical protein HMPREF0731_2904 [Pseudoroseomonas cervicalis ATCC 49957]|uniref:Uncharacterized protein n=1 Tax=Pseudoroseomonas cervicalis ATCC 49957 TaxID=525371 RepID=D5RP93_9PROT|nr:hypothetical protein HMPREF0731_2904 [Pseudoroseomonas cervicalis ATCC 49957]